MSSLLYIFVLSLAWSSAPIHTLFAFLFVTPRAPGSTWPQMVGEYGWWEWMEGMVWQVNGNVNVNVTATANSGESRHAAS